MFSSTNDNSSTYNFPLSYSNSYPPLLHSHENIDIFGRNQDHISLLNDVLIAPESCFLNLGGGVIPSNDTVASLWGDYYYQHQQQHHPYFASREGTTVPAEVKKDRRSKICTAQGLRDRRVRLSINVAREFFDLQDLLGFDKPSKTLEWLLSNSRNAIRDLQRSSSKCNDDNPISHQLAPKDGKMMKKNMKKTAAIDHQLAMAKASRAKARARARERTREKMCSSSSRIIIRKTASPQILSHSSLSNYEILEPAADKNQESDSTLRTNHHESIVTKRKLKASSDQNLEFISASKELTSWSCCCSHMNVQSPNIVGSQNWDMNNGGAFTCPRPRTYTTSTNCNMNHNASGF